tara:strand:+ start:923 stop:1162 length:240 start_codon:yes stop_codon:yes gene_type:complete
MSIDTEIIVETWQVLKEYIPEKDRAKAGTHFINMLQDNGVDREVLDALCEADDVLERAVIDVLDEEPWDDDDYENDLED